jgi:hypothetical protein
MFGPGDLIGTNEEPNLHIAEKMLSKDLQRKGCGMEAESPHPPLPGAGGLAAYSPETAADSIRAESPKNRINK